MYSTGKEYIIHQKWIIRKRLRKIDFNVFYIKKKEILPPYMKHNSTIKKQIILLMILNE